MLLIRRFRVFGAASTVGGVVAATTLLATALLGAPVAASGLGMPSWQVQPTPNPAAAGRSWMTGVSCTSASACVAVGDYTDNMSGYMRPIVDVWNGTQWSAAAVPDASSLPGYLSTTLSGVSCTSPTSCTAVGSVILVNPDVDPAAPRPTIDRPLAAAWNGTAWTAQRVAPPRGPDPNGRSRQYQVSDLYAVSCSSPDACTAVGRARYVNPLGSTVPVIERWDGRGWKRQAAVDPGLAEAELFGVSCTSPTACLAVGTVNPGGGIAPLAEGWDGTTWTVQSIPSPADASGTVTALTGVSCASTTACVAVGDYNQMSGGGAALTEIWNGGAWAVAPAPAPLKATSASMSGVSCTSPSACTAVGVWNKVDGNTVPLAERWDGADWTVQNTVPGPSGAAGADFTAVSCVSARVCIAVGAFYGIGNDGLTLAEMHH